MKIEKFEFLVKNSTLFKKSSSFNQNYSISTCAKFYISTAFYVFTYNKGSFEDQSFMT